MIDYRSGVVSDAAGTARVMRAAWPDDSADETQIARAISDVSHHPIVALDGQTVAGFIDGFTTTSATGARRLEVDLLAVDPAWQGRGIGRDLVRRLTEIDTGCDFARALIRIGNVASERAFVACGYEAESVNHALYVASARRQGEAAAVVGLHVVPVTTLTYSGLWLEGERTVGNLRLAPRLIASGIVGAVIPDAELAALAPGLADYERIGDYRWWRCDYSGRC